jgi:hypothetical protein
MPQSLSNALVTEKNRLHSVYPYVWLIEIPIDSSNAARLALYPQDVTLWELNAGAVVAHVFEGYNFQEPTVTFSQDGNLDTPSLTIANIDAAILAYIQLNANNVKGKDVRILLVHSQNLGSSGAAAPTFVEQTYQIRRLRIRIETITLELGHASLIEHFIGGEVFTRECRYVDFAGPRCAFPKDSFAGDGPSAIQDGFQLQFVKKNECDRTSDGTNGCKAHQAFAKYYSVSWPGIERFGGQPGLVKGKGV